MVSGDSSGIDISEEGTKGLKWGISSEIGKCHESYYEYLPLITAAMLRDMTGAFVVSNSNKFIIDEMRIWTIALSPAQILERMNRVLSPDEINSPELLIYWDFDKIKQGYILEDESSNNLDLHFGTTHLPADPYYIDRSPERLPSTAPVAGSPLIIGMC